MDKMGGTISLIIVFFLLISMPMQLDPKFMAIIAIAAIVVLAAYQFAHKAPGQQ